MYMNTSAYEAEEWTLTRKENKQFPVTQPAPSRAQ